MRAIVYRAFGERPALEHVPDPVPAPDGVVLRVAASGLCRSDWHGWMGHDPDIRLPHVPGHELAGEVLAVGREVRRFRPGDRVTVPFVCGCGRCPECQAGEPQVCEDQFQPGFTAWGSFAEQDPNLVPLPDGMEYATAASLGCRFATAFRALVQQARLSAGEWLAVHGCGGVGLSAVLIGRALGASVVAVDVDDEKLRRAAELGAAVGVNARRTPAVADAVRDATGGGAHVSMDALGHPSTAFASVECLRRRGRHVQVGLLLADQARPPLPMDRVVARELAILGSHGMAAHAYPAMLRMVAAGQLAPERLVGRRIGLEEAADALVEMDRFPGTGITVIERFSAV
jgi:alcohol dehydrogenase